MKKITISINDIKEIKKLMNEVDNLKDRSLVYDGYSRSYGNKELIIEKKEASITNNVEIVANLLNVDFNTVIDMCYDFEFAEIVLKKQNMDFIIEKYGSVDKYIDSTGVIGSNERLQTIANLDLGKRSEAAKRVLERRNYRKNLMDGGISFEHAVLIVNRNYES